MVIVREIQVLATKANLDKDLAGKINELEAQENMQLIFAMFLRESDTRSSSRLTKGCISSSEDRWEQRWKLFFRK